MSDSRFVSWTLPVFMAVFVLAGRAMAGDCGQVVTIDTHQGSTMRYAFQPASAPSKTARPVALVLMAGGEGHLKLDDDGCPRALTGNSLVRSLALFQAAGFSTALVDAPSDYQGVDGLAEFRAAPKHAEDLGKLIGDLRGRTKASVWMVGTSRGTISAANAAARLNGAAAPDGVVLTSALTYGTTGGSKSWAAQTVFDVPLEAIHQPVLVIGHADDRCLRSPPNKMDAIVARTNGAREQVVTVTGGPAFTGSGLKACLGKSPHGFLGLEAEVVEGIARFVGGGKY